MASKLIKALALILGVAAVATAFGGSATSGGGKKSGIIAARATHAQPVTQLIVKYREGSTATVSATSAQAHVAVLGKRAGVVLSYKRAMSGGAHVLSLSHGMTMAQARDVARAIASDPAVLYAEPDAIRHVSFVPNDPGFSPGFSLISGGRQGQWHLMDPSQQYSYTPSGGVATTAFPVGGVNLPQAWNATKGAGVVVGVVDTGVVDHADLSANLVGGSAALSGYDFIASGSNPSTVTANQTPNWTANDGDGRDADPTDAGDWVALGDCTTGDPAADSSWHGTHVSGTIAAVTNNAKGVAGVAPSAKVQHGRALGRCGGFTSDIADAIRWVAGLPADHTGASWSTLGVPANPSPAKIVNLSLGGSVTATDWDPCSITEQNTINAVRAAGVVVVAAAGNDGQAHISSPGNCPGVIAVTAHTLEGDNSDFANIGPGHRTDLVTGAEVAGNSTTISAPGGGCGTSITTTTTPKCANQFIWSTINKGTTTATATPGGDGYGGYSGTSMATPHVAGVAALLFSLQPTLKPDTITSLITKSARHFPSGTFCTDSAALASAGLDITQLPCGAGMLDASAAVSRLQALVPTTIVQALPATVAQAGSTIALTCIANAASGGNSSFVYRWTQTAGTSTAITNATSASASVVAPTPGGNLTFQCAVQDADGFAASGAVSVRSNTPPTIPAIADKTGTAGTAISFNVAGTDPEGDTLNYAATGLPAGATLNPAGAFSWPVAGAAGTYTFTVHANDGLANSPDVTVRIVVSAAAPTPAPASGGGGGAVGLLGFLLLLGAALGLASNRAARG
jgi:serine protease